MIKSWMHRRIEKFARHYGYDAGYVHEIIDVSPAAVFKFGLFQIMASHRQDVPKEALFAAKLAAVLCEDCGPCTQLGVNMGLEEGISARVITALLRGDIEAAGKDAELGFRYGVAVAQNTPDALALAEEAEKRYGRRALVSLAFAVAGARVYPAVKRGLGHGAACSKISVSDETVVLKAAA